MVDRTSGALGNEVSLSFLQEEKPSVKTPSRIFLMSPWSHGHFRPVTGYGNGVAELSIPLKVDQPRRHVTPS